MAETPRRVALVTGTSSGIGLAVANELLARGWDVAGVSRREPPLAHPRYQHARLDLSDLAALVDEFERRFAPLVRDEAVTRVALVNNAASGSLLEPAQTLDPHELTSLYALNVVAPVWCMGFVSRHCALDVPLRIVNLSSGAARLPLPGLAAYGSAKAALRMAGKVLAAEWESTAPHAPTRSNATIVSYEPGIVDTPMQDSARSHASAAFPWVSMFTGFRDTGQLVPPTEPAKEIVAMLEADGGSVFSERRLGD